jgi:integrase
MASIFSAKNGRRRVQFTSHDGSRAAIYLGKMSQRDAEAIARHIEDLVSSNRGNQPIGRPTAVWLSGIADELYDKLAKIELVEPRDIKAVVPMGPFLDGYIASRVDVKEASKHIWMIVAENLKTCLGAERDIASVTVADAEGFKMFLIGKMKLAPMTVHKRLQIARMLFKAAHRRKIIAENPFAEVNAKATIPEGRSQFVTRAEIDRVLACCKTQDWRCIVAFARYGGLRTPSETLSVRWADIDWRKGRIVITSPKTEHHAGGASRTIPLFPELRAILTEARKHAPKDAVYVVDEKYRRAAMSPRGWANANLRTTFEKIVKRAGLTPWPRLFHNLRASRETELANEYPMHVVVAWFGHTQAIALKHYTRVTDADYEAALVERDLQRDSLATQNATSPVHVGSSHVSSNQENDTSEAFIVPRVRHDMTRRDGMRRDLTTDHPSGGGGIRTPVTFR